MARHRVILPKRSIRQRLGLGPKVKPYIHKDYSGTLEFEKIIPPTIPQVLGKIAHPRNVNMPEATTLGWIDLSDR